MLIKISASKVLLSTDEIVLAAKPFVLAFWGVFEASPRGKGAEARSGDTAGPPATKNKGLAKIRFGVTVLKSGEEEVIRQRRKSQEKYNYAAG